MFPSLQETRVVTLGIRSLFEEIQFIETNQQNLSTVISRFYYQNMKGMRRINKLYTTCFMIYIPIYISKFFEQSKQNEVKNHVARFFH